MDTNSNSRKTQELESIKHKLKMVSQSSKANKLNVDDYISNILGSGLNIKSNELKSKQQSVSCSDFKNTSKTSNITSSSNLYSDFNRRNIMENDSTIQKEFLESLSSNYREIINYAKISEKSIELDSQKIYQILRQSHLNNEKLADIWTKVNRSIPGQLNRFEFTVALAMVAYCQSNLSLPVPNWEFIVNNNLFHVPIIYDLNNSSNFTAQTIQFTNGSISNNNNTVKNMHVQSNINAIDQLNQFHSKSMLSNHNPAVDINASDLSTVQPTNIKSNDTEWADFTAFQSEVNDQPAVTNDHQVIDFFNSSDTNNPKEVNLKASSGIETNSTTIDNSTANISINNPVDNFEADFGEFQIFDNFTTDKTSIAPNTNSNIIDKYQVFTEESKSPLDNILDQWMLCVGCCRDILSKVTSVFASIEDNCQFNQSEQHQIKLEIVHSNKGRIIIDGLIEVYRITKNIKLASVKANVLTQSKQLIQLLSEVEQNWNKFIIQVPDELQIDIQNNLSKSAHYLQQNSTASSKSHQILCSLCLCPVVTGSIEGNPGFLTHGLYHYHCPCANLWVNCLDITLPGLVSYVSAALMDILQL